MHLGYQIQPRVHKTPSRITSHQLQHHLPGMKLEAAVVLHLLLASSSVVVAARDTLVPAIYVFGDSTADVGNNNHLNVGKISRSNYPHNGIDYPGGKPTGRFCNGYIAVDFLAQMMGFKESPPAYFSLTHESQELAGVNFASGGSGILDATGVNMSFSMNTQLMLFEKIAGRLIQRKGEAAAKLFLSKSIFIFSTVNNDIFGFYRSFGPTNVTMKEQFTSSITSQFKNQLKKLYDLGARKFVLFGTGLIGCPPVFRRLNTTGRCTADVNELSQLFNKAMNLELQSLSSTSAGLKYSYLDTVNMSRTILASPSHYGFKELSVACCGSGTLNAATQCLPNTTYCGNRKEYTAWDLVHPTQATYEVMAKFAFDGSQRFAIPMNVQKLIQS